MFAQGEARCDMEDAFDGACEVLKKLSNLSPQAEEYYGILTSFYDAISKNRNRLAQKRRQATKRYVNEILTLDLIDNGNGRHETPLVRAPEISNVDVNAEDMAGSMPLSTSTQTNGNLEYGFGVWDNFEVPEDFSFDLEPLGMFFETI